MQTPSNPTIETPPHQTLVEQVQTRREELTRGLTADSNSRSTRDDIESALASLAPMLTGDLAKLPDMVSRDLSRWLEQNKYIGVQAQAPAATAEAEDTARPTAAATKGDDDDTARPTAAATTAPAAASVKT